MQTRYAKIAKISATLRTPLLIGRKALRFRPGNWLLVNQIAEGTLEEGTEGRKRRAKWPDATKLKGDNDPNFTMWLQVLTTKCTHDQILDINVLIKQSLALPAVYLPISNPS